MEVLNAHNEIRQFHGAAPLQLNKRISKTCRAHAQWLAANDIFEHSEKDERLFQESICGENMGEMMVWHEDYMPPNGRDLIFEWYKEGYYYKYDGHFDKDAGNKN